MAARFLIAGVNPYDAVGPGKEFLSRFPLLYPLPAVLIALPFSGLPLPIADACFVGVGTALLAWALTASARWEPACLVFVSIAFFNVVVTSQWATWITAAALLPSLGFLLACKPTVGAALFIAYPNRRALIGAAGLLVLSLLVMPTWWRDWLRVLPTATHMTPPILRWETGGPLLLLALPFWRDPSARLLLAMGSVPQTPVLYEAVPLFLIVRHIREALLLVALTFLVPIGVTLTEPYATYEAWMEMKGRWMVALIYLPCLGIVLRQATASRWSR